MPRLWKQKPDWVWEILNWRRRQSGRTGLTIFFQIQGIYREVPERTAQEIEPVSRLCRFKRAFPDDCLNFRTGNLILPGREATGQFQPFVESKTGMYRTGSTINQRLKYLTAPDVY
jgi:hypothetical protein